MVGKVGPRGWGWPGGAVGRVMAKASWRQCAGAPRGAGEGWPGGGSKQVAGGTPLSLWAERPAAVVPEVRRAPRLRPVLVLEFGGASPRKAGPQDARRAGMAFKTR